MLDNANYTPRLKQAYAETIRPAMKEEFSYKNDMMIPRLDKIVLNIGCMQFIVFNAFTGIRSKVLFVVNFCVKTPNFNFVIIILITNTFYFT